MLYIPLTCLFTMKALDLPYSTVHAELFRWALALISAGDLPLPPCWKCLNKNLLLASTFLTQFLNL